MSRWREQARAVIARVHRELPEDASLGVRRKALRAAGLHFHGGTRWGRKIWGQEVRRYLERHGLPPRKLADHEHLFGADIAFPWKGEGNG